MEKRLSRSWDIFCKVIDNYGDIGVCWRLCEQLAGRGQKVRLIVDDASALRWMRSPSTPNTAPALTEPVEVLDWNQANLIEQPADVVIESFGCELPEAYIATMRMQANTGKLTHWINLEYLSAEPYAERNHKLPSPVMSGVGKGLVKTFFYPGFTHQTGGLLREPDLFERQAMFDKRAWLKSVGIDWQVIPDEPSERIVSLFCYEPAALPHLIAELQSSDKSTLLLVTAGRASQAVRVALQTSVSAEQVEAALSSQLRIHYLPHLTQSDYDHLLWASDFNFVRGEDSLVRALWAGKPFLWHIYQQDDDAHHVKLEAFLDVYLANAGTATANHIRKVHHQWNAMRDDEPMRPLAMDSQDWMAASQAQRELWAELPDLVNALMTHVAAA